jgi:hypothetical protein
VVVVGAVVGAVVLGGAVIGTTVGTAVGGTIVVLPTVGGAVTGTVGAVVLVLEEGDAEPSVGELVPVLDCSDGSLPGVAEPSPGVGVCTAASTAGVVGRCLALALSGSGISGVFMCGPPSRLLTMSTR